MNHELVRLDQLPPELVDEQETVLATRARIADTEHNIEDLLLCLEALRPDDVPHVYWDWEQNEWQPELVNHEHYPQAYAHRTPGGGVDYHIVWSVPICRRDPTRTWNDGQHYFAGTGRQALLFEYRLATEPAAEPDASPPRLLAESIHISLALHEQVELKPVWSNHAGNTIRVDASLLLGLIESIDALKHFLALEKQVLGVLQRRSQRLKERDLHQNG